MKKPIYISLFAAIILCSSCVSWKPGWKEIDYGSIQQDASAILDEAATLEQQADDAAKVQELIATYKKALQYDPDNIYALWKTGNYNILMGAAYASKKSERKRYYKEAIRYCEAAMYTNPEFKKLADQGVPVWEACEVLGEREIWAMGYWYTAIFNYFKDCLSGLGRVFNTRLVIHNNIIMDRMDKIDPTWAGGGNAFSRGIYYVAIPEKFGGSKEKAREYFNKAIEVGPTYLVNRWGRAKYLYSLTGEEEAFVSDLEWVLNQDPHKAGNPFPWNVFFQRQSQELLDQREEIFR
ncbi:MAG: TRAP transporter TatT component family protein [Bacteroidetes bacterium]|nr:TRAP transporter TatT component family protein [Bacteroidota bacterium]